MSFSASDEKKLISCVAKSPVIYDVSHADYHNSLAKEIAWKNIAEKVNKSSNECKKKWKVIRDGYQRFKKKNKSVIGFAAPKNTKDKRHQRLSFLDDLPQQRSGGSNIPQSPSYQSQTYSPQELIKTEDIADNDDWDRQVPIDLPDVQDENIVKENVTEKLKGSRSFKRGNNVKKYLKYWKEKENKRQDLIRTKDQKKDDDVDLFCRHIAEVLRNLPPVYKAEAKKQIGIMVSDYEIKAAEMHGRLESRDSHSTPSPSSMSEYSS